MKPWHVRKVSNFDFAYLVFTEIPEKKFKNALMIKIARHVFQNLARIEVPNACDQKR